MSMIIKVEHVALHRNAVHKKNTFAIISSRVSPKLFFRVAARKKSFRRRQ